MENGVDVTYHAFDRIKERVGLSKQAAIRLANKAFCNGITHKELTGGVLKFADHMYLSHKKANNIRIYGEFMWLFHDNVLITVVDLPNEYKKSVKQIYKKRDRYQ